MRRINLFKITNIFFSVGSILFILAGCATLPSPQPLLRFPENSKDKSFLYSYDITGPKANPSSVPLTVIVVNTNYKEDESALRESNYYKVGKGFAMSMGVDADKAIIAKGMTTIGPCPSLDDITYADKKQASLTLVPKVFISLKVKYLDDWHLVEGSTSEEKHAYRFSKTFLLTIGGWISFVLQEPFSGEKLWVKKLDLEEITIQEVEQCKALKQLTTKPGLFGKAIDSGYTNTNEMIYDGKITVVADYIREIYPVIMNNFWAYLDPEEMLQLQKQTEEIRKLKR